eukprot:5163027-Pyramimonas_sp.AAC.1
MPPVSPVKLADLLMPLVTLALLLILLLPTASIWDVFSSFAIFSDERPQRTHKNMAVYALGSTPVIVP